jgi:ATP-dependent helicase/nuclease subunit B
MDVIASNHPAAALWRQLLGLARDAVQARGAHPARTVVLVPFAQLMPLARGWWAALQPHGFAPRFETTMNWAGRLGTLPGPDDISFDMGRDLLTARAWLERAGLGERSAQLAPRLVEAAWQASGPAAATPPDERPAWAARVRPAVSAGLEAPALALEAALARIAVEWAAASRHAADVLMDPAARAGVDLLILLEGFDPDPLAATLARLHGERALRLRLELDAPHGSRALHEAADPADEAERAAACVVRHLEADRAPVALAAVDRVLTREVRALLDARGIAIRDETGWKLSTTRAAGQVMAALRACAWSAPSDAVLDWLKHVPQVPGATLQALERRIRRAGVRDWADVSARRLGGTPGTWAALIERANDWRAPLASGRSLARWQPALRELLEATGAWASLTCDPAGTQVLEALGLDDALLAEWSALPQAQRRLSLGEFTSWCNEVLESGTFVPPAPAQAQVVVLPLHQLLARPFEAVVVAGCDEQRLPASPEPPGQWTAAQRQALGLPTREALEREQRAAWDHLLRQPRIDLLWRRSDEGGEPLLPSPLVQLLQAQAGEAPEDPREPRAVPPQPVPRPLPTCAALPVEALSASAYEDLRRCPYRFFALRQLGLQEASEIDVEVDKRDFGTWLHQVLRDFHRALQEQPEADRTALLDRCAADATAALGLPEGEFLPFSAAWPQLREGYLAWLREHEAAEGARFESAEEQRETPLGEVRLIGRLDRVDRLPDGRRLVIDYKTEGLGTTQDRVRLPFEDTQLAFYAALLDDDTLRAAYVNIGERGTVKTVEQPAVVEARDALVHGILHDLRAIREGAPMPALGEGQACEFCAARGLCRRDHWHG